MYASRKFTMFLCRQEASRRISFAINSPWKPLLYLSFETLMATSDSFAYT
jgi:hypothetical protein